MKTFKKLVALAMALVMVLALAACGGGSSSGGGGSSSGGSIRLVNGKIEIDAQLKKLAEMYKEKTGVSVEIESLGGGIDIQGTLKGYYQADNMPDIFVNGGATDFGNWKGLLADMSGEAWVSDTDAAYKNEDGVVGFPYTVEAIGFAYNADILSKAGVDPTTLTSPAAYEAAFSKIDGMKGELGLDAVVGYYAEPVNLYWSSGDHLFANYIDMGEGRTSSKYIEMLNDGGKMDHDRLTDFAKFVGLIQQYADPVAMVTGTYDQQILNFASGKYAFVTQGSWIGATMTGDDKDAYAAAGNFKVGMAPYAFQDGMDTILVDSPSWWSVFKNSKNVDAAKAFLQWLTTEEAQKVLILEAGCMTPYKSCKIEGTDPFYTTMKDFMDRGKTDAWFHVAKKEGLSQNAHGQVFADFAQGSLDVDGFVSRLEQTAASYYAG